MKSYTRMDLHSRNTYVGIVGKDFKRVFKKRLPNDLYMILCALEPFRNGLRGIAAESTYNWHWLVDRLMDAGYACVHLADPSAMKASNPQAFTFIWVSITRKCFSSCTIRVIVIGNWFLNL